MTRPRLTSVGSKLAGAIIALVVVVTAGVYLKLSHWQRENLLQAKEGSSSALTRLFIDSCVPALVFDDDQKIKDELAILGRNDDVEYAAVWRSDSSGGKLQLYGELRRGEAVETLTKIPAASQLRRERDRVVLSAPVRDLSGTTVGAVVAALSLRRENTAIAQIERNILIVSSAVAAGIMLLLMTMARLLIVGPLGKLASAARELERGGPNAVEVGVDIHTRDEVGELARAFRSMASSIKMREERINARNQDMRLVLDNVEQGFITLDIEGRMSDERSRVIDDWLGFAGGKLKFWDYLSRIDAGIAEMFEVGWMAVQEQFLPLELCLEQLPRVASNGSRIFEFAYRPVLVGDRLFKVILVITDVTARIEQQRAERGQREMLSLFRRLLSDRVALDEFLADMTNLVRSITSSSGTDLDDLKRNIHTVKGNAALYGLESVSDVCHHLEDSLNDSIGPMGTLAPQDTLALQSTWAKIVSMRAQLGEGNQDGIELDRAEYAAYLGDLRAQLPHEVLLSVADSWRFEPASRRLALIAEHLRALAVRLGRAPLEVECQPTNLRLPPQKWGRFWSAFAHVVRNTVDHGIETTQERDACGKPPAATVKLAMAHDGRSVTILVQDDGPGIDWAGLTARAREHDLPHATQDDLEQVMFADGVSSRRDVTDTSGRGVGLSTVREVVHSLGGRIEIESQPGRGTTFRFVLPESMLGDDPSPAGERDAKSLMT